MMPVNDSVRLLSQWVRKNQVSPKTLLKIMIYGYMNKFYSWLDIENACLRNINFMFLLEKASAPDHSIFARFRSI